MTDAEVMEYLINCIYTYDSEEMHESMEATALTTATSFSDAGIITNQQGLVLAFDDGSEFQISIVRSK